MSVVLAASASGRIAVDAPVADEQWLEAFLAPAFAATGEAADAVAHVHLVDTPADATHACTVADQVAFVLDRRPVRLAGLAAGDTRIYADPELQVRYSVRDHGRDVVVHRGPRDDWTRIALMRAVREYAHNALVDGGGLVIHGAAFAGPRGAVIVTGPKGVGKTTLLARMLASADLSYLANDRVGITPDLRSALSIPTIVAVRSGTRLLLPDLAAKLRPLGRFTELDISGGAPPDRTRDSWYFAPRQFADALPRGMTASAPVAAIVMLCPDEGPGPLRDAAPSQAVALLLESLLGANAGVFVSEIFRADAPPTDIAERLRAAGRRLANAVPCFALPAPASFNHATLDGLRSLCE